MLGKTGIVFYAVFFIVLQAGAFAQAPDTLWTKHYGFSGNDEAWQLKQTADGSFVVVGYTGSPEDIFLLRTDSNGDTLWTKSFSYSAEDIGRSVEVLMDGGYIITGCAAGDCVLIRTDSSGNELWHKYLDGDYGRAVRGTSDGNFIVAGYKATIDSSFQIYIAKADGDGNLIWSKIYGGNEPEMAWDIRETPDGGFIVLGWTESFGNGLADIYLIKTDANGDSLWTKTYGYSHNDEGRSILLKEDGGFIIAGKMTITGSNSDIAVINTDSVGDTIWTKIYYESGATIANSIAPTYDGGYVIAAINIFTGPITSTLMKIDSDGDSLWSAKIQDFSQNLYCRSVLQTPDRGYLVAGYHYVQDYSNDVFLVKFAPEVTGIADGIVSLPAKITLHQNYPNPFNAATTISFTLSEPRDIILSIYDLLGRKISILADGHFDAGIHKIIFDAGDLTSGIYFYNLKAGDVSETKSMILLK